MSSQRPATSGDDWRRTGASAERRTSSGPKWRRGAEGRVPRRARRTRALKIAATALALGLLGGLLVWVSTWLWPPHPAAVVLVGAGYEQNLAVPHNAYGRRSVRLLAEGALPADAAPVWGSGRLRLQHPPLNYTSDVAWDEGLTRFQGKTLVLFFALHGGADQDGAYLLTDDAGVESNGKSRLRLEKVLDRLAKLPAQTNKLLILDATQIRSHWVLGMVQNDFARELAKLEPRIAAIPRLVVLSASDVDQRSWTCDSLGQSVFAATLIEGLQGDAADDDGRIDVEDLFLHVERNVQRWVGVHLLEHQTPVMLPAGEAGRRRARAIELCGAAGLTGPRSKAGASPLPHRDEKREAAWQDYQRLRTSDSPPTIHQPHKWRRYKDVLIRYDELLRAGAEEAANVLGLELKQLTLELSRTDSLHLSSDHCSLTMSAVESSAEPGSESQRQSFETLWQAPPGSLEAEWRRIRTNPPATLGGPQVDPQQGLLDLLIQRAADDPLRHLDRAVELARLLVDPASPPPVEIQELLMIARDVPRATLQDPELAERIALAIRVRRRAERAFLVPAEPRLQPYVGRLTPWVRKRVEEADALRRQGLDLLFASDASSWSRGAGLLERADVIYREVQDDAKVVCNAFAIRDKVLEALPDYSHWLANIHPYGQRDRHLRLSALESRVQQLWDSVHDLVAVLEQGDPGAIRGSTTTESAGAGRPGGLAGFAGAIEESFQAVETAFDNHLRAIDESDLGSLWSQIRIALSVPFDDLRRRERLLTGLERIEQRFLVNDPSEFDIAHVGTKAGDEARAQEQGRVQGLMALSALGRRWFDSHDSGPTDRFAQVRDRLDRLGDDSSWPETVSAIGPQIGGAWRRMPEAIDRWTTDGLNAADPQDRSLIGAADRLWRQLDGSLELPKSKAVPSDVHRRIALRDLLLWQADRTLADHWYSEDPALEPYYRTAGLRFVDDARRLDPRAAALGEAAKAAQAALERSDRFGFAGPANVVLTSEQRVEVEYRLQPEPGLTAESGFPVVWVDPGRDLKSLAPEAGRRVVQPLGARPEPPILCTFESPRLIQSETAPPPAPRVEHSTCAMRGLFRGQRFTLETALEFHLRPELVVARHPVPPGASIAVRAEDAVVDRLGNSSGAIAIVLDCSGSMGPPAGQPWSATTKFREATQALRQVLQGLTRGTTVSVWVFGQAVGFEKTVKEAESTITRIQDPIAWDPADPGLIDRIMARLEYPALEPWNESPIVRTMLSAREDLRRATGFKTLLVLTDGMDNRYENDSFANPHKTPIPVAIRELFHDSGVEVNVVGYKVVGVEAQRARDQFRVIEQLPIPGKFYEVNEAQQLAGVLHKALGRRLRYWIEEEDNVLVPGVPSEGLTSSRVGADDRWLMPALGSGGYKLVIDPLRRQERNVSLNNGDLLLIQLSPARVGVDFRRVEFAREDYSWKPATEKNGWRLAVLQNQLVDGSGLQMLSVFEKAFNRLETSLSVVRPREVWLELAPLAAAVPFAQRWSHRSGYPAAAWSVDVPRWPTSPGAVSPARPIVRLWWNPDQESPASGGLDRGPDFELDSGRGASPIPIEGDEVTVESVRVEDHQIETGPGVREVKSCLVVRLRHAPGKPITVRPIGLAPAGAEQRFYSTAARATALFWPVTRDEATAKLTGLNLYSVDAFKALAERRGFSIETSALPLPRADDPAPQEIPLHEVGISVPPIR